MARSYIVWDTKQAKNVGGPFATNAEATAFIRRAAAHSTAQETSVTLKDPTSLFTVEQVTSA